MAAKGGRHVERARTQPSEPLPDAFGGTERILFIKFGQFIEYNAYLLVTETQQLTLLRNKLRHSYIIDIIV